MYDGSCFFVYEVYVAFGMTKREDMLVDYIQAPERVMTGLRPLLPKDRSSSQPVRPELLQFLGEVLNRFPMLDDDYVDEQHNLLPETAAGLDAIQP